MPNPDSPTNTELQLRAAEEALERIRASTPRGTVVFQQPGRAAVVLNGRDLRVSPPRPEFLGENGEWVCLWLGQTVLYGKGEGNG